MSKSGVVVSTKKCAPMAAVSSMEPSCVVSVVGSSDSAQEASKSWATAPIALGAAVRLAPQV